MTFKRYVKYACVTDTPEGDLIADINRDKQFPNSKSFNRIRLYLMSAGADCIVMDAFIEVWKGYKRYSRALD